MQGTGYVSDCVTDHLILSKNFNNIVIAAIGFRVILPTGMSVKAVLVRKGRDKGRITVKLAKYFAAGFIALAASNAQAADIVDTAVGAGSFKTLVAAVTAAGLVETLKGPGPFTVFAPTDEAFAALPAGTVEDLLKPENKDKLVAVLTYHVVPGKVMSTDLKDNTMAKTVQGGEVTIDLDNGATINGAKVVTADIVADNGVIHVIDTVLLPK
jgi:uncharacterized surface protein with fasciclin (FAS1) repeats